MCYLLLSIGQSSQYPFIVAANRDEYYHRDSQQLAKWTVPHQSKSGENIIGGRDCEQGGTWMAITESAKFAALTNFREPGKANQKFRSRGLLVTDFLHSNMSISAFTDQLQSQRNDYNGFNLIYGSMPSELYYFSNRNHHASQKLMPGNYALSNHFLNTPWPKVIQGKMQFESIISSDSKNIESELFDLLKNELKASRDNLPDTGIDNQFEHLLSSIFIKSENYGTVSSSVILINNKSQLRFAEKSHQQTQCLKKQSYQISI